MAYPSLLRFARPRTFLYLMSLRTGTELITLSLLINKLTGVYGVLALFTGLQLSYMQLSMYIYSIFALILGAWLAPHIRKQSPLQCLALAWFYVLDSIINALYTVVFGVGWFLVLAEHNAAASSGASKSGPGTGMMGDAAGFTNPEQTVTRVEVIPTPGALPGLGNAQPSVGSNAILARNARAASSPGSSSPSVSGVLGDTMLHSGSIASITVISALWAVRVYFILVIMAYARGVLRQHILVSSGVSTTPGPGSKGTLPKLNTTAAAAAAASVQTNTQAGSTSPLAQVPSNVSESAPPSAVVTNTSHPADKGSSEPRSLPSPFHPPASLSAGWPGKIGRILVSIFPSYWLGPASDTEEAALLDPAAAAHLLGGNREAGSPSTPGVFERERRRRAGTGPPMLKPIELERVRK